jgi:hypothetical protein
VRHRLSTYILKNPLKKNKSRKSECGHAEAHSPSDETNGNAGAGENDEAY